MAAKNVIQHLWNSGEAIDFMAKQAIKENNLEEVISFSGESPRRQIGFKDYPNATANQLRTLFQQEMIKNGVLIIGSNNVSWSIQEQEMKRIKTAYYNTFGTIKAALDNDCIDTMIDEEVETVSPLRKVY